MERTKTHERLELSARRINEVIIIIVIIIIFVVVAVLDYWTKDVGMKVF